MPSKKTSPLNNLIGKFGGRRSMAKRLNVTPRTIQQWQAQNSIPQSFHSKITTIAVEDNVVITDEEFLSLFSTVEQESQETGEKGSSTSDSSLDTAVDESPPATDVPPATDIPPATDVPPATAVPPATDTATKTTATPDTTTKTTATPDTTTNTTTTTSIAQDEPSIDKRGKANLLYWWEYDNPLQVGLFLTIAVIAFVMSLSAIFFNFSRPSLPQTILRLEERIVRLEQQMTTLEEQQQNLKTLQNNVQKNSQDIQSFSQPVQQLRTQIQKLEDNILNIPNTPITTQTIDVLLAIGQLRSALQREQPFQGELVTLRLSGFDNHQILQHLDLISPWAAHGILTETRLIEQFQTVAPGIVEATLYQRPLALVVDRLVGIVKAFTPSVYQITQLKYLANIRHTVSLALQDLKNNRLTQSIERLSLLTEQGVNELNPLLKEMRARLRANRIQALLNDHMLILEIRLK